MVLSPFDKAADVSPARLGKREDQQGGLTLLTRALSAVRLKRGRLAAASSMASLRSPARKNCI